MNQCMVLLVLIKYDSIFMCFTLENLKWINTTCYFSSYKLVKVIMSQFYLFAFEFLV